ncbi:MAG: MFS transporter, partial [Bacteroidota bacterium]
LFFARALDGITGGNVSVANAYLADVSSDADRKKNFGLMAASGSLGFIIGPALAGLLGSTALGEMVPVLAAMTISLLAMLAIAFQLKDCPPALHRDALNSNKARKVLGQEHKECHRMTEHEDQSFRAILRLKFVPMILALYFLIFLAFNFFYVAFPVHAISRLQWDVFSLGVFFSVLSGVMVLFQGPVLNAVGKRFSDVQLVLVGCLPLAAAFWLFQYESTVMLYLAAVLFSAGNGLMWPSFLAIVARVAGQDHQGAVQGFASSAGSLASIIGLITGGLLYAQLGPGLFIIPAVLLLGIFAFCFRLPRASNT